MPAKLQEIEGVYRAKRFRFDECVIGEIRPTDSMLGSSLTVKGDADDSELSPGLHYRFYGKFSNYQNRRTGQTEKQFHFQTFVPATAHDKEGVVNYLVKVGKGKGLGPVTAQRAWSKWKSDAVREIRREPRLLLTLGGRITPSQCDEIGVILVEQAATEDATIEIVNLLNGRGFPKSTARAAIKLWGNRAAELIKRDPYSLMAFRGCGFKTCDALWLEMGLSPHRLRRQALCAWYAVASDCEGHTWHPVGKVITAVRQTIGATHATPRRAIEMATRLARMSPDHYGALAVERTDGIEGPIVGDDSGVRWVAEGAKAEAERTLGRLIESAIDEARPRSVTVFDESVQSYELAVDAVRCHRCGRRLTAEVVHVVDGRPYGPTCIGHLGDVAAEALPLADWIERQPPEIRSEIQRIARREQLPEFSLWPDPMSIDGIDEHQRQHLAMALRTRIGILGGSPGTGKTYTTAMLIRALLADTKIGPADIAIGAPTGKAAVRLTEAMRAAGVNLQARTWHSLLGIGTNKAKSGWSFQHNENNPWPFRVLIGDESSMNDTGLMRSIFAARPRGCHVLLVGDVNQLPPVGAGAPLRDLIAAGVVGYGELRDIKRNSGGIVEACAAIRDGQPWSEGNNLIIRSDRSTELLDRVKAELVTLREEGIDPVWECQVLVAVNERSPVSRKVINRELQDILNPTTPTQGSSFRESDKVVCGKNGQYLLVELEGQPIRPGEMDGEHDDGQTYVANGEIGKVESIEAKSMLISLPNPDRVIRVPLSKGKDDEGGGSGGATSWDLAYGITCHKLQGSEQRVVIVILDEYPGAKMVCSREWLYTALSRAKERCVLVGQKATANAMCRRVAIGKRKTLLRERICLLETERLLETM